MNEKENKNRRDLYLKIRVSREELDAIDRKFRNSGMKSRSEFVRAMIFEGYIVQFNEEKLSEILRLARNISGNINQIAVRANSGGRVYDDDISEIKEGVNRLWQGMPEPAITAKETVPAIILLIILGTFIINSFLDYNWFL